MLSNCLCRAVYPKLLKKVVVEYVKKSMTSLFLEQRDYYDVKAAIITPVEFCPPKF